MSVDRNSQHLVLVPEEEWIYIEPKPDQVWLSRKFLVQGFNERDGVIRLSVCRTKLGASGRRVDGISWDELQVIKHEAGYGDMYAVEVYPRDCDLVNVANMRHLWLLPVPLNVGWFEKVDPQRGVCREMKGLAK